MIALGVGFSSRCDQSQLAELAAEVLRQVVAGSPGPVTGYLASLERKRDSGLLEPVAAQLGLIPLYLEAGNLAVAPEGVAPSPRASRALGLASVAEAAALAAAGPGARLVVAKTTSRQATCAAARAPDHLATE